MIYVYKLFLVLVTAPLDAKYVAQVFYWNVLCQ
jgi:hypothetical protein